MGSKFAVRELRIAIAVDEFDSVMRFYRDTVGLAVDKEWHTPDGNGVVFAVDRGTLEIVDMDDAFSIDVAEVGKPMGERIRIALQVVGVDAALGAVTDAGADPLGGPVETPWGSRSARVRAPDGMQLTLFEHGEG